MKLADYLSGIQNQDQLILSKCITLVESTKVEDRELSLKLLDEIIKMPTKTKTIGVSGTPGVGKSTFLNAMTKRLIKDNKINVAILAIDPSSRVSGGSILGDKTRMGEVASLENVFIRPTPSSGVLGGVAASTYQSILICQAFNFDYLFIETVGVGQSESELKNLVDYFMLLIAPGEGDDLQAIKKGVLELADMVLVNKSDGDMEKRALQTLGHYSQNLRKYQKICSISSLTETGLEQVEQQFSTINEIKIRSDENFKKFLMQYLLSDLKHAIQEELMAMPKIKSFSENVSQLKKKLLK